MSWDHDRAEQQKRLEGRTTEWLARYCGTSIGQMQHYLSGRRKPQLPVVKLIAQALNTTEQHLMAEDSISSPSTQKVATS